MSSILSKNYYNKDLNEIFQEMNSDSLGLEKKEAKRRLLENGPNKLPEIKPDNLMKIFLRQFQSPLIFILILASEFVFLTGEKSDGFVILFVLFFNAVVGTMQEGKAQNIFATLKNFTKTNTSVIREGEELIISDEELVVGDIIIVREGEKIPADARILNAESLQINEAILTGESGPKFKLAITLKKAKIPFAEQKNMIFKGTNVVSGNGKAIVVATGLDTIIGNIAKKISSIEEELPLKKDIRLFSRFIIFAVISVVFFLLITGLFHGYPLKEIVATVVAISVSVIPEGLPIVVTLVLATGVWRMGENNIMVKKLQAVEALGRTDIIAVDKTGTLTKNELIVREIYSGGKYFTVKGEGYEPKGDILNSDGKIIDPYNHQELILISKIGALCNGASLALKNENWIVLGDPTEAATLVLAEKIGFHKYGSENEFMKIEEKPFDYKLKYHAVIFKEKNEYQLLTIGAPEEIMNVSEKIWSYPKSFLFTDSKKEQLKNVFFDMSQKGFRVVALAVKKMKKNEKIPDKLFQMEWVGFLGIEDSLRNEVKEAVEKVKFADIELVMITGDNKITAKAIAKKVGILKKDSEILEGTEIDKMKEEEFLKKIDKIKVFCRVTPFHKLKIINAYKSKGKIIAMTGDGVNDALSLASADIGVAMGKIGTEVAKEASDIILLDDNFGNIVYGVEEGRNIYRTIKRVVLYLFSTSMGEILTIVGAIFLGFPLPILATQILWLNLVTDGFIDVALVMEPKKHNLLGKNFISPKSGFLNKTVFLRILIMSLSMAVGTLYLFYQNYKIDLQKAWTISLTTLAVFQWFNAWNCRSQVKSIFSFSLFSNKFLVGALIVVFNLHLLAIYNPFFQKLFKTVPLSGKDWFIIIAISASIIISEEIRKFIYRWKKIGIS